MTASPQGNLDIEIKVQHTKKKNKHTQKILNYARACDVVIQIKEAKSQIKNENCEMPNRIWNPNGGLITVIDNCFDN